MPRDRRFRPEILELATRLANRYNMGEIRANEVSPNEKTSTNTPIFPKPHVKETAEREKHKEPKSSTSDAEESPKMCGNTDNSNAGNYQLRAQT